MGITLEQDCTPVELSGNTREQMRFCLHVPLLLLLGNLFSVVHICHQDKSHQSSFIYLFIYFKQKGQQQKMVIIIEA